MGKIVLALLFLLVPVTASLAQDKPVAVTGAYQFTRLYGVNVPLGWDASVNIPVNDWFGVVGDFGAARKSAFGARATLLTFGGGPQLTLRTHNVEPYIRLVVGGAHVGASAYGFSAGATALFIAPGGGADFRLSDHIRLRLGANYPVARKYGVTADGIQIVLGVTYKFGGRNKITSHVRQASSKVGNQTTSVPVQATPTSEAALLGVSGYATDAGFKITSVRAGSPAAQNYLNPGDTIFKIDGRDVQSSHDIEAAIAASTSGTVKVTFHNQTAFGARSEREVRVR
jgi:membrane-associated protease RseP (regulator of RpoE activity)